MTQDLHGPMGDQLRAFLADRLPDAEGLAISGLSRSGGGSSKENWAFDATWQTASGVMTQRLMVRRDPPSGVVETGQAQEFALLQALEASDVAAPRALWLDADGSWFERPAMVVERAEGRASRGALRPADPLQLGDDGRLQLAHDMVDTLVRVHAVDVSATGIEAAMPPVGLSPGQAELGRWEQELTAQQLEPQPALRLALRWLQDHLPDPPVQQALVHGDFRPANVLVSQGRFEVLLDWELAHLGDPVDDLGWYACSIYRAEHFFPGWGVEQLLERYEAGSGRQVSLEHLKFWRVMSSVRLAIIALTAVRAYCDGLSVRPMPPAQALARRALAETQAPA